MLVETRCPKCGVVARLDEPSAATTCANCGNAINTASGEALETLSQRAARETPQLSNQPPIVKPSRSIKAIGRFQLQAILGEGMAGTVYRAHDPVLDRMVAIKVPKTQLIDEPSLARFLREARSAAALRHAHIVAVFEVLQEPQPALVCEYVDGLSLADRLSKGRPELRRAVQWVHDLAEALAYAHARGVVHRDIKPANILINTDDEAKLSDFGLARRNSDAALTREGNLLGSPAYMSPEAASENTQGIGPASDQYSLGVVLYELITGRRPFEGTTHDVIVKVIGQPPPRPRTLRRDIPQDLESICLKAMEKRPAHRYASAGEFAADLRRWLNDEPVLARQPSRGAAFIRRRWPVFVAAAATVVLLAAIFYIQTDKGRLKIETTVDDVQVVVSQGGNEVTVVDLQSGSEVRLRSGKYELALKGKSNDAKLSADRVEMSRGGEAIVTIQRVAKLVAPSTEKITEPAIEKPVEPPPAVLEKTADRRAAEWILSVGGSMTVNTGSQTVAIRKATDLPGNFQIVSAALQNRSDRAIVDDDLKNLVGLKALAELNLAITSIEGRGLQNLQSSIQLKRLTLDRTLIDDDGSLELAKFPNLRALRLNGTSVSDAGLRHLMKLRFESLDLGNTAVTDNGLELLRDQDRLYELSLYGANVTNAGLKALASLPALKVLTLSYTRVTGAGLEQVAKIPQLTDLMLSGLKVADGLHYLARSRTLRRINIASSDVTDETLAPLADVPALINLEAGNVLTGRTLGALKSLESLNLGDGVQISVEGAQQIAKLTKLRTLWVVKGNVTGEILKPLCELPNITGLNLSRNPTTDNDLTQIAKINTLRNIVLDYTKVTENGIADFKKALPSCHVDNFLYRKPTTAEAAAIATRLAVQPLLSVNTITAAAQGEYSKRNTLPIERENALKMELRLIPPGKFAMGTSEARLKVHLESIKIAAFPAWYQKHLQNEAPQHLVHLTRPFYLSATEVTVAQFDEFAKDSGRKPDEKLPARGGLPVAYVGGLPANYVPADDHPATNVSWNDAVAFCKWLSKKETAVYRLPTEAEWEAAARAGESSEYCYGNAAGSLSAFAWHSANSGREPRPVGLKSANVLGLFDMHGNVWEWCADHAKDNDYASGEIIDPIGPDSTDTIRRYRGGGWDSTAGQCRSAARLGGRADTASGDIGFRVVREVTPGELSTIDRAAAEWALKVGADLTIEEGGRSRTIQKPMTLPTEAFRITELYFRSAECAEIVDNDLQNLQDLASLRKIELLRTKATGSGLVHLRTVPNLSVLVINNSATDDGLIAISQLKKLKTLNLYNARVTNAGIEPLSKLQLEKLLLYAPALTDACLEFVGQHESLNGLSLNSPNITDAGLGNLQKLSKLRYLDLNNTTVTDEGLKTISTLSKITTLHLSTTRISGAGLSQLNKFPALHKVVLRHLSIDDGLKHLANNQTITALDLEASDITDEGIEELRTMPLLNDLQVVNTAVTGRTCGSLKNLRVLNLNRTPVDASGLQSIATLPELVFIGLDSTALKDDDIAALKRCPNLKDLFLKHTDLTDSAIVHLKDCRSLKQLRLEGTKVTAAGLHELRKALPECNITP